MGKLRLASVAWKRKQKPHEKRHKDKVRERTVSLSKVWTKFLNSVQWEKERLLEEFKSAWH